MSKKRVLLTGATGLIGSACRRHWGDHYDLRLFVHDPAKVPQGDLDVVVGGCEDMDLMMRATEGMDAVAHLGAIPGESTFDKLLQSNVVATYNVLEAARVAVAVLLGQRLQALRRDLVQAGHQVVREVRWHQEGPGQVPRLQAAFVQVGDGQPNRGAPGGRQRPTAARQLRLRVVHPAGRQQRGEGRPKPEATGRSRPAWARRTSRARRP